MFVDNCKKAYIPGSHLTVDEQLVSFRGRAPFRVYMKSKPDRYGIKIWALVDCATLYTMNLQIYLGKLGNKPEKNQGARVVLDLVQCVPGGRGITTDNFTSKDLSCELQKRKLTLCGTLKQNKRFIPKELLPHKEKPLFSSMFSFQRDVTLVSYVPKPGKSVILLSSEHHQDSVSTEETDYKPDIILHYNSTKGSVDAVDKMAKQYSARRISNRWPMVLFGHLIDMAAINAHQLWLIKNPSAKRR